MENIIYTYGYGSYIYPLLNAIAIIIDNKGYFIIGSTCFGLASSLSLIRNLWEVNSQKIVRLIRDFFLMAILVQYFLVGNSHIWIKDEVTGEAWNVEGLPKIFVTVVGASEGFARYFAEAVDKAVQVPALGEEGRYTKYGMTFGAQLIDEVKHTQLLNIDQALNLDRFIYRCGIEEAAIGERFTMDEFAHTPNILDLIEKKGSKGAREVRLKAQPRRARGFGLFGRREAAEATEASVASGEIQLPCSDAATLMRDYFLDEENFITRALASSDLAKFGQQMVGLNDNRRAPVPMDAIKNNIALGYNSLTGGNQSAEEILRQIAVINSLKNWTYKHTGNALANLKAQQTQEANASWAAQLAETWLPRLLVLVKGLVFFGFLLLPLAFAWSGSLSPMIFWTTTLFAMDLWAPIYSVLNMFVELAGVNRISSASGGIISYATFDMINAPADKMKYVAMSLQTAIAGLSFVLIGKPGFMHTLNAVPGNGNAAAAKAAAEQVDGNVSMDNRSFGNSQRYMHSAHQSNLSSSMESGSSTMRNGDGSVWTQRADGRMIIASNNQGATASVFDSKINVTAGASQLLNTSLNNEQQLSEETAMAITHAEEVQLATMSNYLDKVGHAANSENIMSNNYMNNISKGAEKAMSYSVLRDWAKNFDNTKSTSFALNANGSIDLSVGAGKSLAELQNKHPKLDILGTADATIKGGVGVSGEYNRLDATIEHLGKSLNASRDSFIRDNYNNIMEVANNKSFNDSLNVSEDLTSELSSNNNKLDSLREEQNYHNQNIDRLSTAKEKIEQVGNNYDIEATIAVSQMLQQKYGYNPIDAHRIINEPSHANTSEIRHLNTARQQVTEGIIGRVSGVNVGNLNYQFVQYQNEYNNKMFESYNNQKSNLLDINNNNNQLVNQQNPDLNKTDVNNQMEVIKKEINNNNDNLRNQVNNQIDEIEKKNNKGFDELNKKVEKKERGAFDWDEINKRMFQP